MSFVGDLFSGAKGAGFQAQGMGNMQMLDAVNQNQIDTSYGQSNDAIKQQQAFVNALQAQGGIQNQSNVFSQQQSLANQMQGLANGTGPNPAQAALAQATGANVANQSALMAGQRGAGSNVGMMARQAGQQGGAIQQQAAGQSAIMQAQQQIAAMNALSGQQANMANLSTNQVGQQATGLSNLNQFSQNEQNMLLNAAAQRNATNAGLQTNVNNVMGGMAQGNQKFQQGLLGGAGNAGASALMMASGGAVNRMAPGGMAMPQAPATQVQIAPSNMPNPNAPKSMAGQSLKGPFDMGGSGQDSSENSGQQLGADLGKGLASLFKSKSSGSSDAASPSASSGEDMINSMGGGNGPTPYISSGQAMQDAMMMAKGGRVPALVSPGEIYLPPKQAQDVAKGKKNPMRAGERIPGKAKVPGDSLKNDTVKKNLQEGGLVIPRSVVNSPDAMNHAIRFVRAHLSSLKK